MKPFWTELWVESSSVGRQVGYQERVEARVIKGGLLVHTVVMTWTADDRSISDSLVFIPNGTLEDLGYGQDT